MNDSEIKTKFNSLTTNEQKQVNRETTMIKLCGSNHFFIETGCQVDKAGWLLVAFAMMSLNLITSKEFYGV